MTVVDDLHAKNLQHQTTTIQLLQENIVEADYNGS